VLGDVVCDAGEVDMVAAEEEAGEKFGVGVPAVGEERSQQRRAPSEPPGTRIGCTGCHARAVWFMASQCAGHTARLFMLDWRYLMIQFGLRMRH
jgi:hypothetical protein